MRLVTGYPIFLFFNERASTESYTLLSEAAQWLPWVPTLLRIAIA